MRIHELRKTLAWYSRGLHGGSGLRQASFTTTDVAALRAMGEEFFAGLAHREAALEPAGAGGVLVSPANPIAKAIARNVRRAGLGHIEADEERGSIRDPGAPAAVVRAPDDRVVPEAAAAAS